MNPALQYIFAFLVFLVTFGWLYILYKSIVDLKNTLAPLKPGDKVTAFGNVGTVKSVTELHIIVKFDDFDSQVVFNKDGKLMSWHKKVSLRRACEV
jgi:preprotein translocase subunit YajC